MKPDHRAQNEYSDEWLAALDSIASGDKAPFPHDDELLQVAERLYTELAPLRDKGNAASMHHLRQQYTPANSMQARSPRSVRKPIHRFPHSSLLIATLLLLVITLSIVHVGGLTPLWSGVTNAWHNSTSFDQLQGISVASLPRPHKGIEPLPLLPASLPGDTQASTYGVITDTANPNLLITFVADYRIAGQDVLLYEQPSAIPFSTSSGKTVAIGGLEGRLFQDERGTNALQWYDHGMACQLTSKLPVARLVDLATGFQPLKSWELIL
jgi:hypothetical protein